MPINVTFGNAYIEYVAVNRIDSLTLQQWGWSIKAATIVEICTEYSSIYYHSPPRI